MSIENELERRGLVLCGIWREHDGELMLKAAEAIKLLRNGRCPECGADMRIFSTNCKNTVITGGKT